MYTLDIYLQQKTPWYGFISHIYKESKRIRGRKACREKGEGTRQQNRSCLRTNNMKPRGSLISQHSSCIVSSLEGWKLWWSNRFGPGHPRNPGSQRAAQECSNPWICREIPNNPYTALSRLLWCQNRRLGKGLLRSLLTPIIHGPMIQGGPRALGCQATCQANILGGKELWQEAAGGKWASALGKPSLQRHKVWAERPAFHWHVLQPYHQGTINLSGALAENSLFLQGFCGTSSWICHCYSASTLCLIICLSPATPCPEQLHTAPAPDVTHTAFRWHCEQPIPAGTNTDAYKFLTFSSTSLC